MGTPSQISGKLKCDAPYKKKGMLTICSLVMLSYVAAQDYTNLKLGVLSRNFQIDEDTTKYFKLTIDQKIDASSQDLVFKVFDENNDDGDPDLYISKTNKKPNRVANSEWTCSNKGKDTCTINGSEFKEGDTFYIGVRCGSTIDGLCSFSIKPTLTGEIILEDGEEIQVDFGAYEAKVFKFQIPAQGVRDSSQKVNSVVITAAPILPSDEVMNILASTKGSINPKSPQKRGVAGWRKGQTLRLSADEDSDEWCNDCFIYILVDVENAGKYQIMARTNIGQSQLQEGVKIDDVVFYGDKQCYKYFVKDSETDVNIKVQVFSGMISYVFNPKTVPEDYNAGVFQMADFGSSQLVISPQDRSINATKTGLYYLCMFSAMTSTYSALIQETPINATYHFLEDGWDQQGEIQGKNRSIYLYKTPALQFKYEDIQLEFLLTSLSGEIPKMYARFCRESMSSAGIDACASAISEDDLTSSKFTQAISIGKGLSLTINHDENQCAAVYNGACYYTIVLLGQSRSPGDLARYQIKSDHSQKNYQILAEGKMISDYVDHGAYRYYSFTLAPQSFSDKKQPRAKNLTIQLNTLHGDADLFVSKSNRHPNKADFDKSSVKSNENSDLVFFEDPNGKKSLSGTYYIAVYSLQYSTFTILVSVDRTEGNSSSTSKKPIITRQVQTLIEGVPYKGQVVGSGSENIYKVDIKQLQGYEKPIKFLLSPLEGSATMTLRIGAPPTDTNYTSISTDHILVIDPVKLGSRFIREGSYYIRVQPKANYFMENLLKQLKCTYLITYYTEDSYLYLKTNDPLSVSQNASSKSYTYFRHYVSTFKKDITLSMTVFTGSPILYATFDPEQKWPNSTTPSTFNSKSQIKSISKSKALFFPQVLVQTQNPACTNFMISQDPCVLYASVSCFDDCKYSIKLSYESSSPQQVIIGYPQHNIVKDGTFNYYYIVLKQSAMTENHEIVGVLQSLKGNTDLYVKYINTPSRNNPEEWDLPNESEYVYKSNQLGLKQDVIKINSNDQILQDCFQRFDVKYGTDAECAIVFGVKSEASTKVTDLEKSDPSNFEKFSSSYNFIVYMGIMQLMNQVPVSDTVELGDYQYYIFESNCDDCTLLVSLSVIGNGDPDLYINFGDEKLPSKETANIIKSSTFKSEMIAINKDHSYFKTQNITSIRGTFLLGVYGSKKSNYTLIVSLEKHPMALLMDNHQIKASQEPFDIVYYAWYNLHSDEGSSKDFKVSIKAYSGSLDVYMTTFIDSSGDNDGGVKSNIIERLPKSKRDSQWILSDIESKTDLNKRELVVLNSETNYCTQCIYLIGVVTHEKQTDYSLMVSLINQADFKNAQILKLGETYETVLNAYSNDNNRVYRFILDDPSPLQIVQTMGNNGQVSSKLSFYESGESPIFKLNDNSIQQLSNEDSNFQIGRVYYLLVQENSGNPNVTLSILLMQEKTIIHIQDGVPQVLKFKGKNDKNKKMILSIPDGTSTFQIQIKTRTENFYPKLYVRYHNDIESDVSGLEFPPDGPGKYYITKNWDHKLGILSYQERFDSIKGGKAGLALNLQDKNRNTDDTSEVILTVSSTPVIKLFSGISYISTLNHSESFNIYQIDETLLNQQEGYLMVDFTQCIGETEIKYLDNPNQPNKYLDAAQIETLSQQKHGRNYQFIKLPKERLYVMIKQMNFADSKDQSADYILKVRSNSRLFTKNIEFQIPDDGKLSYEFNEENSVNIKWGSLSWINSQGVKKIGKNVTYTVVVTRDKRVHLDTQCVLRKEVASKYVLANFNANQETNFTLKTGKGGETLYVNVLAKVQAENEKEPELIPYEPLEIYVPQSQSFISKFALLTFILIVLLFGVSAIFYHRKSQEVEKQLEFEMADVRNVATVSSYHKRAEQIQAQQAQKYQSLSSGSGDYQGISIISEGVADIQPINNNRL